MNTSTHRVIGLMSGTSLDGLDICLVNFSEQESGWDYKIEAAQTIPYPETWVNKLLGAEKTSGEELKAFDQEYGKYLGESVFEFLSNLYNTC